MTTTSPSSVRPKRGAAFRRVTAAGVAVVAVGAGLVSGTGAASAAEFDPYKDLSVYQVGPSLSSSLPAGDRTYQVGNDAFDVRGWARYGHLTVLDANGDQLCGPTFSSNGGGSESCTVPARELGRQTLIAAAKDDDGKILGQRDIRIEVFDKPNPGKPGGGDGGQTPEPVVAQPNPGVVDAGFSPFPTPEPVVANPNPGVTDPGFTPQPAAPSAPQKLEFEDASVAGNRVSVTLKGQAGDDVRISQNNKMLHAGKVADDGRVRFEMFGTPGTQEFVQVIAERGGSSTSQVIWFDVPARAEAQPNPGVVDAGFSPFPTPEPVVANPNPGVTDPGFTVQPGDDGEEQDVPGKGTITTTLVSSSLLADGTARLRFRDESAASPYSVEIWLDGKPREAATVTSSEYSPQDTFVRGFGAGHHVIEIRSNGVVIDTLEFDV